MGRFKQQKSRVANSGGAGFFFTRRTVFGFPTCRRYHHPDTAISQNVQRLKILLALQQRLPPATLAQPLHSLAHGNFLRPRSRSHRRAHIFPPNLARTRPPPKIFQMGRNPPPRNAPQTPHLIRRRPAPKNEFALFVNAMLVVRCRHYSQPRRFLLKILSRLLICFAILMSAHVCVAQQAEGRRRLQRLSAHQPFSRKRPHLLQAHSRRRLQIHARQG